MAQDKFSTRGLRYPFNRLLYFHRDYKAPNPESGSGPKRIELVGLDSEAYSDGRSFLFALSDGNFCGPAGVYDMLLESKYRGKSFVVYNLKYEEGALLHGLPAPVLESINRIGWGEHEGYEFRSIPSKELVIRKGHKSARIYDIAQFYQMTLNRAAFYYLGKQKLDMETKEFSPDYVRANKARLIEYCIWDAVLTKELGDLFVGVLIDEFGIYPQKLYSVGYISGIHFSRTCRVVDINRFWTEYRELVAYAYEAYSGGKFEIYSRGFGYFYQYDLNSAYASEIANLQDLQAARVLHTVQYQARATYGFLKCRLRIADDFSPVAVKQDIINYYPVGVFVKTITKAEYDYLIAKGESVEILDAWWLFCRGSFPYRAEVERLFALKATLKGTKDTMYYELVKKVLNAFYGKLLQVTEKFSKAGIARYEAGYLFNPIYGAVITANIRLALCKVSDAYSTEIVAVHTDSVISTAPIHRNGFPVGEGLGEWAYVNEGEGVVVGCGIYQVGEKAHFRGFHGDLDLVSLIRDTRRVQIPITERQVLSWRLVLHRGVDLDTINRFVETVKVLNLNFDKKRRWERGWSFDPEFRSGQRLIPSLPIFYADFS